MQIFPFSEQTHQKLLTQVKNDNNNKPSKMLL